MNTGFPSLAEVVAAHRWMSRSTVTRFIAGCTCGWEKDITNTAKSGVQLQGEHVEAAWFDVRTIRTREQLAALPNDVAVRSMGAIERDIYERDDTANMSDLYGPWIQMGFEVPCADDEIELPALLIYHPDWTRP